MRRTKIIATLGPSSETKKVLTGLVKAGMNVARLNMSHGGEEDHKKRIDLVKEIRAELGVPVAILFDTRGPEVRLGDIADGKAEVFDGDEFTIVNKNIVGDGKRASVTIPDFYKILQPNDYILVNDGLIRMDVKEIVGEDIIFKVVIGGVISSHKSINVPGIKFNLPYLGEKDKKDLLFGIENGIDFVAASFVSDADDIRDLKRFLRENGGGDIDVIAKIENKKGVENIDAILEESDGIMVARGDLGVEISYESLPPLQKTLIKKARLAGKRVITATEMLESMIENPRPTRAETSDVANAVYDGTSAIMLSGETAAGKYPIQAVKAMSKIAEHTEQSIHYRKRFLTSDLTVTTIADAISSSAVKASMDLNASAILVVTESGRSARMVSRFRPICPIIGITTKERSYYKLALSWGVVPVNGSEQHSMELLFRHATEIGAKQPFIKTGDTVVTVASTIVSKQGTTNLLKIETIS